MGQGIEILDANGDTLLDSSHSITLLVREVNVTTTVDGETPSVVTKDPVFLNNTGFYVRNLEQGFYRTRHKGTHSGTNHAIKETQTGDTYTIQFPPLAKGCNFNVHIGAY